MTTVLCGSLSLHPVSLGALMHRAGYAALGLDYAYVPFRVSDLADAIRGMRALGIRGLGVSVPFKREVMPLLDALDPLAARIGAVNTIVNEAGRLIGHNTDAVGGRRALEEVTELRDRRGVVIGAGGAARAIVFALCDAGARVHVANRTPSRAAALAESVRLELPHAPPPTWSGLDAPPRAADVLVNASSAGMKHTGGEVPVEDAWLAAAPVVMDIVYQPIRTRLLERAAALGARTVHGGRMLLHQAAGQFALYTGRAAPLEAMDAALTAALD